MDLTLFDAAEAIIAEIKASQEYLKTRRLLESFTTDLHLKAKVEAFAQAKLAYAEADKYGRHHPDWKRCSQRLVEAKTALFAEPTYQAYIQSLTKINEELSEFTNSIETVLSECLVGGKPVCHKG